VLAATMISSRDSREHAEGARGEAEGARGEAEAARGEAEAKPVTG